MAERVADVADIRNRLVAELLGREAPGVPVRTEPFVLVARDLAPADTALLDPAICLAIVTLEGGPTSHTAILSRCARAARASSRSRTRSTSRRGRS